MSIYVIKARPLSGMYCMPNTLSGKLRMAMDKVGLKGPYSYEIFTQVRKNGTRRLKLWRADNVFYASQEVQKKMESLLKEYFGETYIGGYFAKNGPWTGSEYQLCIILKA